MKKILLITLLSVFVSSVVHAKEPKTTLEQAYADDKAYSDIIDAATRRASQEQLQRDWEENVSLSESSSDVGLEAHTGTNGYVILNKDQGLIKQWGRIKLPANSLGQRWISFPKRMRSVFTINVSSSDPYTSSGCRNCVIETGARVKNYNSSGFNITNGFVGDGKGGVYAVTLYWEAMGKL